MLSAPSDFALTLINLPAIAVVISGSSVGDPREADAVAGLARASELILNGFGRAGRPGFSNQSVSVLVSDNPYIGAISVSADTSDIRAKYPMLAQEDAAVQVRSPLTDFIDRIAAGMNLDAATEADLGLAGLLADPGSGQNAASLLRATFGGYVRRQSLVPVSDSVIVHRLERVRDSLLQGEAVPTWLPEVAASAGVGVHRVLRMVQALQRAWKITPDSVVNVTMESWLEVLLGTLAVMPPRHALIYADDGAANTARNRLGRMINAASEADGDNPSWLPSDDWTEAWKEVHRLALGYMRGEPYTMLASGYFKVPVADVKPGRASGYIPQMFKLVGEIVESTLAVDAGCLVLIVEKLLQELGWNDEPPEALGALPLCVRNGCNDLSVLAWFRHGYRQRIVAHAFAAAYPLPDRTSGEVDRRAFVELTKRSFTRSDEAAPPVLEHARTVLKYAAQEARDTAREV